MTEIIEHTTTNITYDIIKILTEKHFNTCFIRRLSSEIKKLTDCDQTVSIGLRECICDRDPNQKQITLSILYKNKIFIVTINNNFPFKGPKIQFDFDPDNYTDKILSNYYDNGFAGMSFCDIFTKIIKKCDFTIPSYSLADRPSLLIGSHPSENKYDRMYHDNENVYLLDSDERFEPTERFIRLDFTNLSELEKFAQLNDSKFTTICFDWSVWKFFMQIQNEKFEDSVKRLNCLHKILKTDGVLIIPTSYVPSCIMFPRGTNIFKLSEEEKKKIYDDAINYYHKRLCPLFINSNFKFKVMQCHDIDNELFKVGPLAHPQYSQTSMFIESKNYVIVAMK